MVGLDSFGEKSLHPILKPTLEIQIIIILINK